MQQKKNPKKDIGRWSLIFFQVGLIVVLFVSWRVIEMKTYAEKTTTEVQVVDLSNLEPDEIKVVPHPQTNTPPPPPPPKAPEKIKIVDDDKEIEETEIKTVEDIEKPKVEATAEQVAEISDVQAALAPEPEPIAEVPFRAIEDVPVFPGCEQYSSNDKRRECMEKKIQRFVARHFDTELGRELGLQGRISIYTVFTVDENGNITDVKARATNPVLKKEAIRVVKMLPHMTPGKQRGKAVRVIYNLPIVFEVH